MYHTHLYLYIYISNINIHIYIHMILEQVAIYLSVARKGYQKLLGNFNGTMTKHAQTVGKIDTQNHMEPYGNM